MDPRRMPPSVKATVALFTAGTLALMIAGLARWSVLVYAAAFAYGAVKRSGIGWAAGAGAALVGALGAPIALAVFTARDAVAGGPWWSAAPGRYVLGAAISAYFVTLAVLLFRRPARVWFGVAPPPGAGAPG